MADREKIFVGQAQIARSLVITRLRREGIGRQAIGNDDDSRPGINRQQLPAHCLGHSQHRARPAQGLPMDRAGQNPLGPGLVR